MMEGAIYTRVQKMDTLSFSWWQELSTKVWSLHQVTSGLGIPPSTCRWDRTILVSTCCSKQYGLLSIKYVQQCIRTCNEYLVLPQTQDELFTNYVYALKDSFYPLFFHDSNPSALPLHSEMVSILCGDTAESSFAVPLTQQQGFVRECLTLFFMILELKYYILYSFIVLHTVQ